MRILKRVCLVISWEEKSSSLKYMVNIHYIHIPGAVLYCTHALVVTRARAACVPDSMVPETRGGGLCNPHLATERLGHRRWIYRGSKLQDGLVDHHQPIEETEATGLHIFSPGRLALYNTWHHGAVGRPKFLTFQ